MNYFINTSGLIYCFSFGISLLTGASLWAAPVSLDRIEASANTNLVFHSDLQKFRDTLKLRSQIDHLFAETSLATKGAAATDAEIRDYLVDERIILQLFPVTDTEVEQEIGSIQTNIRIDRAGLKATLKEQGFRFEDYFELIRISASKRNLIDREIRTKVSISDDDIKNYFYNHLAKNSSVPMAYHLKLMSVTISNYKTLPAARDVLQRAVESIKSGESFDEVAKRSSDHPTASAGGDLGSLTDDQMSPQIKEQVKKLKIGQISDIFGGSASGSFYIIKLIDVKSSESEKFAKMKDQIRGQLMAAEFQRQLLLWLERQRQAAFIHKAGDAPTAGLPVSPSSGTN